MITGALASAIVAHIPFIEPLPLAHRFWWLLALPVAVGVSMAWKAVRLKTLDQFWRQVASMTFQILVGVAGIAIGLYILIIVLLPMLPAE